MRVATSRARRLPGRAGGAAAGAAGAGEGAGPASPAGSEPLPPPALQLAAAVRTCDCKDVCVVIGAATTALPATEPVAPTTTEPSTLPVTSRACAIVRPTFSGACSEKLPAAFTAPCASGLETAARKERRQTDRRRRGDRPLPGQPERAERQSAGALVARDGAGDDGHPRPSTPRGSRRRQSSRRPLRSQETQPPRTRWRTSRRPRTDPATSSHRASALRRPSTRPSATIRRPGLRRSTSS